MADGHWARVGSSNLNVSSWLVNCELDVAIEDTDFAQKLEQQYEQDLANATEIVLPGQKRPAQRNPVTRRVRGGSSSRAAAGALRLVNAVGAVLGDRRVFSGAEASVLPGATAILSLLAALAVVWPRLIAWPLAAIMLWLAASLLARYWHLRHARRDAAGKPQ